MDGKFVSGFRDGTGLTHLTYAYDAVVSIEKLLRNRGFTPSRATYISRLIACGLVEEKMRSKLIISTLLLLIALMGQSAELKAQQQPRYRVVDLGTLGGPISYGSANGDGGRLLNDLGVVSSYADTTSPDPFAPDFCFDADCLLAHAFRWHDGIMTDLGALAPGFNSLAAGVNDAGWSIGASQTGRLDPNFPQNRAVVWTRQKRINLGVLRGGSDSIGISLNNAGQAVGISDNGVPDPFSLFQAGVQIRTFFWQHGVRQDIGTLGGPDTVPGPGCNNQRPGTVVGASYTSFIPNPDTGVPTLDPFLWHDGKVIDLGNLGGTMSFGQCMNNHGEIIGQSNLAGDLETHAFVWRQGNMDDLGTLGGPISEAIWINDSGDIAGSADLSEPGIHDAVVWRNGRIKDLGTVDGDACSRGRAINSSGVVVGGSSDCSNFLHAFVWQEGGRMRDLNKLIPAGSGLQLTNAININDRGEILAKSVALGVQPIDDEDLGHIVLLIPCDTGAGCSSEMFENTEDPPSSSTLRGAPAETRRSRPVTARESDAEWRRKLATRSRSEPHSRHIRPLSGREQPKSGVQAVIPSHR
jgi:probable HAF family extracellular repeat protein